jgi:predicted transposase/invertase (TIGR01784 family)
LADPVITAIFQNGEVSGLAMKSLLNAKFADSGDSLIRGIASVTPQRVHSESGRRGYRIDVEAVTDKGEIALFDVQMSRFASTVERSLLYSEQALASRAVRGDKLTEVTYTMPKVVVLNILDFELRKSGKSFHQVIELMYREEPAQRATDKLVIHNLELPKFRRCEPDFTNPLHIWLTAMCRTQELKKPMREIVEMDENLKSYYKTDDGFAQFSDRHGIVAANSDVRKEYRRWEYDRILSGLEAERLTTEGEERGEARHAVETARRMLADNLSLEQISKFTLLPFDKIRELRDGE